MLYIDWKSDPREYGAAEGEPRVIHVERPKRLSPVKPQSETEDKDKTGKDATNRVVLSRKRLRDPALRRGFPPTNRGSWVQLSAPHYRAA